VTRRKHAYADLYLRNIERSKSSWAFSVTGGNKAKNFHWHL